MEKVHETQMGNGEHEVYDTEKRQDLESVCLRFPMWLRVSDFPSLALSSPSVNGG